MNLEEIYSILRIILGRIDNRKFNWRLEGSANLLVQGVKVNVNDLDITTDKTGLAIFREILKDLIVKDSHKIEINADVIICKFLDNEIEIASYQESDKNMFEKTRMFQLKDLIIPVLPLKDAIRFYEIIGRRDKIEVIKKHLKGF